MNDAELLKLEKKFKKTGLSFVPMDQLHGFLTGIACAPTAVMPNQWLPMVFDNCDEIPEFKSEKEAESIITGLFDFLNSLIEDIRADDYGPYFSVGEDGVFDPRQWCLGFLSGISSFAPDWDEKIQGEVNHLLLPILFLADEAFFIKDSGIKDKKTKDELLSSKEHFMDDICFIVPDIYNYWQRNLDDVGTETMGDGAEKN